jgi:succinyl-diaminopimelate desuccinylase
MIIEDAIKRIDENKAEMISSLSALISVPSIALDEGTAEAPFGENVAGAYEYMMNLAAKEGFSTFNAGNYGGHIDFKGSGSGIAAVIGHLDVVPEGDGWDFDPYGGEVKDGYICGRGATDDKGPVIASFYAMKALRECGYTPKRTIRLILGLDEETNWHGMDYYVSHVDRLPDFGFTPDADFPAINGEMGILIFDIVRKFDAAGNKGLELSSLKGGTAANSVADYARAVLHDCTGAGYDRIKQQLAAFREEKGCRINCKGIGKSFEIVSHGVSAHGAYPEQGVNAISIIMEFLGRLNFANESTNDFLRFYNEHIGYDLHGERAGCAFEDSQSGKLIFNVGMIALDKKTAQLTVNIRYPVTMDEDTVYGGLMTVLGRFDLGIVKNQHQEPIYMPADSPLITKLMDIYRKHTGDESCEPVVIGGGTYARAMDNIVAFGAKFPEREELAHQKNEKLSIDDLVKMAQIYAEAIYELSEME